MQDILKKAAQKTRRWATRYAKTNHFPQSLAGLCAIASIRLHAELVKEGVVAQIAVRNAVNDGHCFVIVDDQVIDVTATQFGKFKAVSILPRSEAIEHRHWNAKKQFGTAEDVTAYLRKAKWPAHQIKARQPKPLG